MPEAVPVSDRRNNASGPLLACEDIVLQFLVVLNTFEMKEPKVIKMKILIRVCALVCALAVTTAVQAGDKTCETASSTRGRGDDL